MYTTCFCSEFSAVAVWAGTVCLRCQSEEWSDPINLLDSCPQHWCLFCHSLLAGMSRVFRKTLFKLKWYSAAAYEGRCDAPWGTAWGTLSNIYLWIRDQDTQVLLLLWRLPALVLVSVWESSLGFNRNQVTNKEHSYSHHVLRASSKFKVGLRHILSHLSPVLNICEACPACTLCLICLWGLQVTSASVSCIFAAELKQMLVTRHANGSVDVFNLEVLNLKDSRGELDWYMVDKSIPSLTLYQCRSSMT